MKPIYFADAAAFRAWLLEHHDSVTELWVGYYKRASGRRGLIYPEALDEALCFGWIDGRVQSIDEHRYIQRFTPRRKGSYWSAVNVKKAERLMADGRMHPSGLAVFTGRTAAPHGRYSNENRNATFEPAMIAEFKTDRAAWHWFENQAPSFRRVAVHWVTSARRPETRAARFATLVANARKRQRPPAFDISRPRERTATKRPTPAAAKPAKRR